MLNKTILVVEDEADLLELIHELLDMEGYTVLNASSASAAFEIWEKHSDLIDLLLTDLTLPDGTTGVELAGKLHAKKPLLKIIFTSGHTADMVANKYPLPSGASFLQKPFYPNALSQTVQRCLNS